jgi:hypothetical protein
MLQHGLFVVYDVLEECLAKSAGCNLSWALNNAGMAKQNRKQSMLVGESASE